MKITTIKKEKEKIEKENLSIPPVKGGDEKNKKKREQEINRLETIINYLQDQQNKNPSPENEDKLNKAKDKLKDLESNPPPSPTKNKDNSPATQPSFPRSLIIGVIFLLLVAGIGFLVYRAKKKKKIRN
ncbi:MAG: hypothetical protein NY202_02215 [Mollicutes bacterium UO1]